MGPDRHRHRHGSSPLVIEVEAAPPRVCRGRARRYVRQWCYARSVLRRVFELETVLDEVAGALHGSVARDVGPVPLVAVERLYLGAMCGSHVWEKHPRRTYFKIDLTDFVDFATSGLPAPPLLGDFENGVAGFSEGLGPELEVPDFAVTYLTEPARARLRDFVTTRAEKFVSVTARFGIRLQSRDAFDQQTLCTLVFGLRTPPGYPEKQPSPAEYEQMRLLEWERSNLDPPVVEDPDWRLFSSGIFLDEKVSRGYGIPEAFRERSLKGRSNSDELFELTRLGLCLPAYIRFMYDLVENERAPIGSRTVKRIEKRGGRRVHRNVEEVVYRTIKSIRVVRPPEPSGGEARRRKWTAPSYAFAVHGHWRHFADPSKRGHDKDGVVVFGKTWITDYTKGQGAAGDGEAGVFAAPASEETRNPKVTIGIKQPLYFARDVIQARQGGAAPTEREGAPATPPPTQASGPAVAAPLPKDGPSPEWRAAERAKLTAGLRYLILKRDKFTCQQCGKQQAEENYVRLEVDHKTPIDLWGKTEDPNLWTLCKECNRGKSARAP